MEGDPRNPRVSLLRRYDIPIEHLTYEYLEKCINKKELERIIRILRSGEEGSYPDLLKFAEKQLRLLAPDSRVLRVEAPVLTKESLTKEEWDAVEKELKLWEEEMSVMDKSLDFEKGRIEVVGNKSMPEVRKVVQPPKSKNQNSQKAQIKPNTVMQNNNQRIKSGDYAAWDKFDVDKELLKIDIEEERKLEENEKKKREVKKLEKEKKIEIASVDKENYSSMEQQILANQAKDRGNECYKSEDLENALKYYEISIKLYPTSNAYNNRAMTYLKLKQYENAIKDCNKVLNLEKNNIKALHRRATAYQNVAKDGENTYYEQLALQDLCKIIQLEPNNKTAQTDLQKLKKKLNIEETGKKFRMPISEELIYEGGNSSQNGEKNVTNKTRDECNIATEKLPLTYYGPSTSTFQCEPHSMAYRALSGSSIPGQVLCKCNSNRLRQNPLCQKCGEAMCTPKPMKAAGTKSETKLLTKRISEMENEIPKPQTNKTENSSVLKSNPVPEINEKNHVQPEVKYLTVENKKENSINNNANNVNELGTSNSTNNSKRAVDISKSNVTNGEIDLNNLKRKDEKKTEKKCQKEKVINDLTKSLNNEKIVKNTEFVCNKYNETIIPGSSSSQSEVTYSTKKSKNKKKKSKDHKENKTLRKHLESFKIEPVKVVHAAKYLHPTSVEPKVTNETSEETRRESNFSSNIQYKAFVPNRKCCSIGLRTVDSSVNRVQSLEAKKAFSAESDKINNDLSFEGNKENIVCNIENLGKGDGVEEIKKEFFESSYEFTKKWEEFKKFDESYCKRAEIIRKIRPDDLSKVIGIKLDSEMLSCLLECLLRHFVETDPKRVIELLKELTQVPRFGLVSMFLADTDKKKMKKLIETAENKGFKLDEDIKKNLMMLS